MQSAGTYQDRQGVDVALRENHYIAQRGHWDYHPDVPVRRRCGVRRLVRKGHITRMVWVPCKSRRCTLCIENIVGAKMEVVLDETLYGVEIDNTQWMALQRQLNRARNRGEDGDYMRIPTSRDRVLVVSNREIGFSIDCLNVELTMREALPEWGNITHSKDWKPVKATVVRPDDADDETWVDYGIVTGSQERFEQTAADLHLRTIENKHGLSWVCEDSTHRLLVVAAECMRDADYWARMKNGWDYDVLPDLLAPVGFNVAS